MVKVSEEDRFTLTLSDENTYKVLWDQILTRTMPERPVWGYSCDDMHNADQLFKVHTLEP